MLVVGSIASEFGTAVGVAAGMIAAGGFVAHVRPALDAASERETQEATIAGGLIGLAGTGLSLGALVPLVLAADGVARVVMRYGDGADGRKR